MSQLRSFNSITMMDDLSTNDDSTNSEVDVWFDDGTLIIQAGEKSFRVYRGILSRASSVFRDMLSLAVTDGDEVIDGCPVVHVSDSAADMSFFIRSLHDTECVVHCFLALLDRHLIQWRRFFMPPNSTRPTFAVTAGILRLSTKYDVPFLRRRALHHLSIVYPISLKDWDASSSRQWLSPRVDDHFLALNLAREFDIAWIRPMAIYRCMSKPISEIFDVFQKTHLSPEDRNVCALAIQKLKASEMICVMTSVLKSTQCSSWASDCPISDGYTSIANSDGADPLAKTDKVLDIFKLCPNCSKSSRAKHSSERLKQWNAIPQMVECLSWEDLATMRKAALA